MVAFHKTLSDETVYSRYFGIRTLEVRTEPRLLQQICTDDPDKGLTLVAGKNANYPQDEILARLLHHEVVVDKVGGDFGAGEERSRKAG